MNNENMNSRIKVIIYFVCFCSFNKYIFLAACSNITSLFIFILSFLFIIKEKRRDFVVLNSDFFFTNNHLGLV